MKLTKVILYIILFPLTLFIIIREFVSHLKNKKEYKQYSYDQYKLNKEWTPHFKSGPINVLVALTILLAVYLTLTLGFNLQAFNIWGLIGFSILTLIYLYTALMNHYMYGKVVSKKQIYSAGLEQEIHIEHKFEELNNHIKIDHLKANIQSLESIFDCIASSKRNTSTINDVLGYEELIFFQYNAVRKYYDKQLSYLKSYKERIPLEVESSLSSNSNHLKDMKEDQYLKTQKTISREIVDELLRYIANFNSFMKHNITSIIDMTQTLNEEFVAYLERIHALDELTNEQYHEIISYSLTDLDFYQIKSLITNRKDVIKLSDLNGNTLLHHAVIQGNLSLVKFLLDHGAHANQKNNKGYTALHYATKYEHQDIMNLLVGHGAFIEFVIHDLTEE